VNHSPMPSTAVGGAALALRGLRLAVRSPEVRRVYLHLALALLVTSLALMAGLGFAIWSLLPSPGDELWKQILFWTLRIGGTALVVMTAPLLALFVINIVFPFLGERVFMAGLRLVDPGRAAELEAAGGVGFATSVGSSIRRLVYFIGVTLLTFMLTLVPVFGAVLGPAAQLWFTSRMLSWELLDPYFERRGLDYAGQKGVVTTHRTAMFGFGAPWTLLLALPIVGPLGFGLAQAAAALLVTDIIEQRGRAPAVQTSA
jgi:CysZ protein